MKLPYPDKPVEITPAMLADLEPGRWLAQFKENGWRCMVHLDPVSSVPVFTSRHMKRLEPAAETVESVQRALLAFPAGTIFDGEWMSRRDKAADRFNLFDLVKLGRVWGREIAARDRLAAIAPCPLALAVPMRPTGYAKMFADSRDRPHCEGIVLRRADSRRIDSVRKSADNPLWLKCKWLGGEAGTTIIQ